MLLSDIPVFSVPEVARILNISGARVRQLLIAGEMNGSKFGQNWAIPGSEIEKYKKMLLPSGRKRRKSR